MRDELEPPPPPPIIGGVDVGVGGIIGAGNVEVETAEDKDE